MRDYEDIDAANRLVGSPVKADFSYGIAAESKPQNEALFQPDYRGARNAFYLNLSAATFSILIPCLIFSFMLWILSFAAPYERPGICHMVTVCCFCVVAVLGLDVAVSYSKQQGFVFRTAQIAFRWYILTFAMSFVAWSAALCLGSWNYSRHMQQYYDFSSMKFYSAIDPRRALGQEYLDMGLASFTRTSYLDRSRSMAFKDDDLYCVAPVVSDGIGNMSTYDFWAVGLNCCTDHAPGFSCGDADTPNAHSAVRVLRDDLLPKFRLAVQQAESAYNIKVRNPIFVHWVLDPLADQSESKNTGYQVYVFWTLLFFSVQLFLALLMYSLPNQTSGIPF